MSEAGKPDLLIVDDDPVIADTLSYVLGDDFNVRTAESRSHAKAQFGQQERSWELTKTIGWTASSA